MFRSRAFVSIGILVVTTCAPGVGAARTVCPASVTGHAGATVYSAVVVDNPQGIDDFQFDITFNPDVATFVEVLRGPMIAEWMFFASNIIDPGRIRFGGMSLTPIPTSDPGTLLTVVLQIVGTEAECPLCAVNFSGDLTGTATCCGTVPVVRETWGRIRAAYR